jgi:hypothetical protein
VLRGDLASGALARSGRHAYERWLDAYWRVARHVLAR